jgi:hypothetical protein
MGHSKITQIIFGTKDLKSKKMTKKEEIIEFGFTLLIVSFGVYVLTFGFKIISAIF